MVTVVKLVLQMIGLGTVIWFLWVIQDEYKKIRQEQKENENEQSHG